MPMSPKDEWVPELTLVPILSYLSVPSGPKSQINGGTLQSFRTDSIREQGWG